MVLRYVGAKQKNNMAAQFRWLKLEANREAKSGLIIKYFELQFGWHPVAVVQYTLTHKQYTEYRERNKHNKKYWEMWTVPNLCELYHGVCLTTEEKARKNLRVVEKCPDIPVAVVRVYPDGRSDIPVEVVRASKQSCECGAQHAIYI
jgi:hypothetical protein